LRQTRDRELPSTEVVLCTRTVGAILQSSDTDATFHGVVSQFRARNDCLAPASNCSSVKPPGM